MKFSIFNLKPIASFHAIHCIKRFSISQKGFTLAELLIAIAIITILSFVSVSALRGIQPSLKLNGEVRDLVSDLRYAQQLAVAEQIDHGIVFLTATEKYQIVKHTGVLSVIKEDTLPAGVNFYNVSPLTDNEIRFNPYGAAREEGSIILINEQSATTTIEVSPSGFVKIFD